MGLPPLTEKRILAWADAFYAKNGKWPSNDPEPISGTEENWSAVDQALRVGVRGLPGGSSLAQLLAKRRGKRNKKRLPPLSEAKIIAWAHRHFLAEGRWPEKSSGAIPQSPGDTWRAIDAALRGGYRGLPGGSGLTKLLGEKGVK
jgi:hypothetical protein